MASDTTNTIILMDVFLALLKIANIKNYDNSRKQF